MWEGPKACRIWNPTNGGLDYMQNKSLKKSARPSKAEIPLSRMVSRKSVGFGRFSRLSGWRSSGCVRSPVSAVPCANQLGVSTHDFFDPIAYNKVPKVRRNQ